MAGEFLWHARPGDWLGDGMYFWQDAPERALEWATQHHAEPAVVGAEIILKDCLDLLDIPWEDPLREAYLSYRKVRQTQGKRLPVQKGGNHDLDRKVINFAVDSYRERGIVIRAVRAAFQEGQRIYPRSALFNRSHVQVVVRDPDLMVNRWREGDATERGG